MERNLEKMAAQPVDILVIGGGIYGACIAWDAALRGLSVALVEKRDFGHATSANSLKTLHGGLRYLQDGNLPLCRTMIRERRTWLHIAPHLTQPLPFLLPTQGRGKHSRLVLAAALKLNDLVGLDRNRGLPSTHQLPVGRTFSRSQSLRRLPNLAQLNATGCALWYDVQLLDSERMLLSILHAATSAGANVANYAAAKLLRQGHHVVGAAVTDQRNGRSYDIRARLVVNCTGAWTDTLLRQADAPPTSSRFPLSAAVNLVTRQIVPDAAFGFFSHYRGADGQSRRRILFAVPWRDYSLIGTLHLPYTKERPDARVPEAVVQSFLAEINAACPADPLSRDEVFHVQMGFLPAAGVSDAGEVRLLRQSRIHDHEHEEGITGLMTVVGVKYSTARRTAEKVVDMALRKLERPFQPCSTSTTSLAAPAAPSATPVETHIRQRYGCAAPALLACLRQNPDWSEPISTHPLVLVVEMMYAMRHEMAHTLTDLIRRRTPLGAAGVPDDCLLHTCANLMATELGWSGEKKQQEITAVQASYTVTVSSDDPSPFILQPSSIP